MPDRFAPFAGVPLQGAVGRVKATRVAGLVPDATPRVTGRR